MIRRFAPIALLLAAACSGPAAVVEEVPVADPEPVPVGPSVTAIWAAADAVESADLAWATAERVAPAAGRVIVRDAALSGARTAVVTEMGDSLRIAIADAASGTFRVVHSVPAPAVVTTAWSPDASTLVFGYYRPVTRDARPAMGAGDILEVDAQSGTAKRVGCSASKAVLAWASGASLLVRDSDNLYVVDRDGCGTRSSVDARRMHGLSASPDGRHIAYVHRELVYDRQTRQYEPDSTFMLAAPDGSGERMVVGFRYRPARFRWSADGSELAYDVQDPDRPERRQISIFDVAAGTSAFLHAPATQGPSEFDARWSPDGSRLLYSMRDGADRAALAVWTFGESFPWVIPDSEGAEALMWAGSGRLVMRDATGRAWLVDIGGDSHGLPEAVEPLALTGR